MGSFILQVPPGYRWPLGHQSSRPFRLPRWGTLSALQTEMCSHHAPRPPIRAHSQLPQQQISGPLWLAEVTGRPVALTTAVGAPGPEQNLWLLSCWASLLWLSWLCFALGPTDHLSLYCFSVILVAFWETPRSDTPALTATSNRSLGSQDLTGPWCFRTEPGCAELRPFLLQGFPQGVRAGGP